MSNLRFNIMSISLLATLGLPMPLSAQETTDSIPKRHVEKQILVLENPIKHPGKFIKAINKFMDFSAYDTTYIEPNHYNYAFMVNYAGNYESYRFGKVNPRQSIEFAPNVSTRVGLYFGWRWIFLGYTFDTKQLFHNKKESPNTEFVLSLYSSKLGLDVYYRKTGNDFKIKKIRGFDEAANPEIRDVIGTDFDGLRASMKGLNLYYIWNNDHFSYPAAYSQSTNQKISCGSWIAGMSYTKHKIDFNICELPMILFDKIDEQLIFSQVNYHDFNVSLGYSYNWVFAKNCLFNISFTPAVAYKSSKVMFMSDDEAMYERHKSFNFDVIGRSSIVWNNKKYYIGALGTLHGYNYKRQTFDMFNMFTNVQFYIGFNFNLKKEYRTPNK